MTYSDDNLLELPEENDVQYPTEITNNICSLDTIKFQYVEAIYSQNEGTISILIGTKVQTFKNLVDIINNKAYKMYLLKDNQRFKCIKKVEYTETVNGELVFSYIIKENNKMNLKKIIITSTNGIDISSITYSESVFEDDTNKVTVLDQTVGDDKYPSAKVVYDFTNTMINNNAVYYITKNAAGNPFSTKAELDAATTFYSGGVVRVPKNNDYCLVEFDETHSGNSSRYSKQGDMWQFQVVYEKNYSTEQMNAINSGISSELVTKYDEEFAEIKSNIVEMRLDENKIMQSNTDISSVIATLVESKRTRYKIIGLTGTDYGIQSNTFTGIKYVWYGLEINKPDAETQKLYKNTIFLTPESLS